MHLKKVDPVPGDIMALGEMKVEKRIIIRSIVGSPLNIALVVLVLLLLAAGGYWWMLSQPSPDDKAQQIAGSLEQTAIPTFEESGISAAQSSLQPVTDGSSSPDKSGAVDDSDSLPPAVTEEVASVGSDDNQQRVVIESNVVDALLEGKADSADTKAIDDVVGTEKTETADETSSPLIKVVKPNQDMTQAPAQSEEGDANQPVVKFSFAREELKALSPRAYTLQLAAMTSMEDVQSFLNEHQLNNQVRIYPTVRNDTEWYIITYQDYPTIQMARDAVASLPDSVKSVSPWAKSLRQVHREIERVK
ncbi:DamX-related protein [Vibrio alginolyticus 12G01]|nr:DamX-related protein [Vibrio alginolyticus 12G01]